MNYALLWWVRSSRTQEPVLWSSIVEQLVSISQWEYGGLAQPVFAYLKHKNEQQYCPEQVYQQELKPQAKIGYCICSSYYLFHHAILCSLYLRAPTNWEQHLMINFFVNIRALRKASFIFEVSSFLISRCFATKWYLHGTSNPFPCFLVPRDTTMLATAMDSELEESYPFADVVEDN